MQTCAFEMYTEMAGFGTAAVWRDMATVVCEEEVIACSLFGGYILLYVDMCTDMCV